MTQSEPEPELEPVAKTKVDASDPSELSDSPPKKLLAVRTLLASFSGLTAAEKLERLLDLSMDGLAIVHAFLAKWLPIIIGFCVRTFCRLPIPARFCVGFSLMAITAALAGWVTLPRYFLRFEFSEEHMELLGREGFVSLHGRLVQMMRYLTVFSAGAAAYAWVKRARTIYVFKSVLALQTLFWIYVFSFFTRVPSFLNGIDHKGYDKYIRNEHWMNSWTPWTLVMVIPVLLMLGTALRSVYGEYQISGSEEEEEEEEPLMGDQVLENLKTGGADPRMRSSNYWASFVFFSVLALPFLMTTCGWEKPYGLPKGSGEPVVEMVKVKKKKKKPQKRMIVNNWSPYIFERMKIDDIKVLEELDEQSMDTYEIMQEKSGKLGKGGGKKGGWPEGMEGTVVRFIRLKYKGGDWDQGMKEGSDINLLNRFNQITGFPVARESEAKTASRLKRFPKGRKPPFVYLTGKRGLSFSSQEIKTLKWYTLEEGGMLFIDDGGPGFGRQVENLMRRLYPGNPLVDIPNDDPIFQAPFVFPNGAPPLWQHSGSRAKGIRHNGRWVVFFHPGDVGDAWINNANEVKPEIAEQAYRLGINVMYYAFNRYYEQHFE